MRWILLLSALCAAGCARQPAVFAPPEQRQPLVVSPDPKFGHFAMMSAPDWNSYVISDVEDQLENAEWRWAGKSPTFQFRLPVTRGIRLRAKLFADSASFAQTGPLEIAFYVGARKLGTAIAEKPDQVVFEKDVPKEWLSVTEPVTVRIETDKLVTDLNTRLQRSVMIHGIGFVQ